MSFVTPEDDKVPQVSVGFEDEKTVIVEWKKSDYQTSVPHS